MTTTVQDTSCFEILSPDTKLSSLMRKYCAQHSKRLNLGNRTQVLQNWGEIKSRAKRDLFIIAFRGNLLDETNLREARYRKTSGIKRFLLLPDDSPQEAFFEKICQLGIRTPERIHTPRLDVDTLESFLRRFIVALSLSPMECTIADAWWEGDLFVVLSPTFTRIKVPVGSIPIMNAASPDELAEFEIDEYGEYVYWPSHDVHMGWSQFEQIINPEASIVAKQNSHEFNKRYGKAIQILRDEKGLRQSDIPDLDPRTIRRIEQGDTRATSNALHKLAMAHGMTVQDYMNALAEKLNK